MKKVLLIRGNHDGFTSNAFDAAEKVITHANENEWDVVDKAGNGANKDDVLAAFDGTVNFVIHYGHGGKAALFGQKRHGNRKQKIFDTSNVDVLKGVKTSTVSCLSAKTLGPLAAPSSTGTNAYLGYEVEIAFPRSTEYLDHFVEAYNTPNIKLLDLYDFQTAYDAGRNILMQKYDLIGQEPLSEDQFFAQAALLWAHDGLKLCGNGSATAT